MKLRALAPVKFLKSDCMETHYPAEALSDPGNLAETMHLVEQMFPDRTIVMCQRNHNPRVQYVTPHCNRLFGLDARDVYAMSLPEFLALAHPDDIASSSNASA